MHSSSGAVWTFPIYHSVQYDDPREENYCDVQAYRFSFCSLIITFVMIWITLLVFCFTTWIPKLCAGCEYSEA